VPRLPRPITKIEMLEDTINSRSSQEETGGIHETKKTKDRKGMIGNH
jgi:hypothetical protein